MNAPSQANGPIAVTTPLGQDALLLTDFKAHEAISQLFRFRLDLLALNQTKVPFESIVGKGVTVQIWLPDGGKRYFNGIVNRFSQGHRDHTFTFFRAEVVPSLWQLTRNAQSRIFQHLTVPEILRQVLVEQVPVEIEVKIEIVDHYQPRDYCVQYRESDFAFASRLMEEEGIYYFFTHTDGHHQMVVTDMPEFHPDLPGQASVIFETMVRDGDHVGPRPEMRVTGWEKTQELRSGKYTLWDHCFELPDQNLEAKQFTLGSVQAGTVVHKLQLGGNDQWEIYDYPGGYAQRFDGVDPSGGEQPGDLAHIGPDGERTVKVRMQQEQAPGLEIQGVGNCRHFLAGHQFTLTRHFDGNGSYLLTRVAHRARWGGDFRTSDRPAFEYENDFTCIPTALPYRPLRVTPRPAIAGLQTATVVGPPGPEAFCDPYGRVKVQFHWDRHGKRDGNSSCWIRVAQPWAGKQWGAFFWPRVGHEVVVAFEEGDPDQPLIVGSVYNRANMPPWPLPWGNMIAGFKSKSNRGNLTRHFNGILFVDMEGQEHLTIHSERHMVFNAEYDKKFRAGRHQVERVPATRSVTVGSLPDGGGSGGGPSELWPDPEKQGHLGLNSVVVYGINSEIVMPLNFQMVIGSNLEMFINPIAFAAILPKGMPPPESQGVAKFLGSGLGGNLTLTLGNDTNIMMGQTYELNLGPRKIVVDVDEKTGSQTAVKFLGIYITVTAGMFMLAYSLAEDDSSRTTLLLAFQAIFQLLLVGLMMTQKIHQEGEDGKKQAYRGNYYTRALQPVDGIQGEEFLPWWGEWGAVILALATAAATPLVVAAEIEPKIKAHKKAKKEQEEEEQKQQKSLDERVQRLESR